MERLKGKRKIIINIGGGVLNLYHMNHCKNCGKATKTKGYECNNCVSNRRRYEMKKKAITHLGGKCVNCGYNGHLAALEFHHLNPKEKDFTIGKMMNRKWDSIVKEIDKCIILCSNCHRIEHSKYK